MDHDHDHAGGLDAATDRSSRRARRLWVALGLNLVIVAVQVVAALAASSLGLLADAGHNLTDVAAVAASLVAVRMARRPPTASRSFGFYRGTILAAQFNAALILVLTVWLAFEAIERLRTPEPVEGGIVLVVALLAAAANGVAALVLVEGRPHPDDHADGHGHGGDLGMRSALLHTIGDAAASLGVAVAGAIMLIVGGWYWLDPITSLVIGALIAVQAWKLLRTTTAVLLEGTPEGLDLAALASLMAKVDGVDSVHDLHVWSLSTEVRALSAHLVLSGHPSLEEAQATGRRVKDAIRQPFDIAHATLELECESCDTDGDPCEFEGLTVRVTRPADTA
jgi:cobalt-zinc-cadmium efflux system protein